MSKGYFAVILFTVGGVYGADPNVNRACERAVREARDFAKGLGGFKPDALVKIGVYDSTAVPEGENISYGPDGVFGPDGNQLPFVGLYHAEPGRDDPNIRSAS